MIDDDKSCLFYELMYFDPSKPSMKTRNLIMIGIVVMLVGNIIFMTLLKLFGKKLEKDIEDETKVGLSNYKQKKINPITLYFSDIMNSVIYAPITEELFFRFFIFKSILIRKYKMDIHKANVLQALIFGGFHLTNQIYTEQKAVTTWVQILSATISGLINGYVYYYTNSIIPSVVSHIANNLLATPFNFAKYSTFYENINVDHK
jgi:membrane protease YdiL (CAAX protease family)